MTLVSRPPEKASTTLLIEPAAIACSPNPARIAPRLAIAQPLVQARYRIFRLFNESASAGRLATTGDDGRRKFFCGPQPQARVRNRERRLPSLIAARTGVV